MKVKDAMHKGVEWVPPTTPISKLAELMNKHDIGAIPVGENDRLVGMVTDRDIVCRGLAKGLDPHKATAKDVMTKGIVYCREEQELDDAVRQMEDSKIRRLPVLNKEKRMTGMLALGDVSHKGPLELSGEVVKAVSGHHR